MNSAKEPTAEMQDFKIKPNQSECYETVQSNTILILQNCAVVRKSEYSKRHSLHKYAIHKFIKMP